MGRPFEYKGRQCKLSADGLTIAISNDINNKIEIYKWNGEKWDRTGLISEKIYFDLSGDGQSIIVLKDTTLSGPTIVKEFYEIFKWNGTNWVRKGELINVLYNYLYSIPRINYDGTIFCTSEIKENINSFDVYDTVITNVYKWSGTNWELNNQLKELHQFNSGGYLDLNIDSSGNTITVQVNSGNLDNSIKSYIKTYKRNGLFWENIGKTINNENKFYINSGMTISGDGKSLVIGCFQKNINNKYYYYAAIYNWINNDWKKTGFDIINKNQFIGEGLLVGSNYNGTKIVSISEVYSYGARKSVKVFEKIDTPNSTFKDQLKFFRDINFNKIRIESEKEYSKIWVQVININGQLINTNEAENSSKIEVDLGNNQGLYFIQFGTSSGERATFKSIVY